MSAKRSGAAVVVVGGGHAGVEAALAAARMGCETVVVTGDPERICTLPCNPSIGGSAKGQLVREIDALGGEMARLIDRTSLHIRFLNESKGPAVRALRAQADKAAYARAAIATLRAEPNVRIVQGLVDDLDVVAGRVRGVRSASGAYVPAGAVVLATGTFLGARIYRGEHSEPAGRAGEAPALLLAERLRALGFPTGRLKTGTPPRLDRRTVDVSRMTEQLPSTVPLPFSYRSVAEFAGPQLSCYVVHTNVRTHSLVRDNLHRSPLYGLDLIRGIGPRYCPSIEDKVVKFAHNPTHLVFIEPEGWNTDSLYVGGFSTSLPEEIQREMVRTLPGCEDAELLRPGYAVEYDHVPPTELYPSLETRRVAGLFHCGQLNGTSGYEEAAAQGLIAGINAARAVQGAAPLVLGRDQAYIGVLIDDLVTRGVDEPYRMLTSRAEHRVLLRHDNADTRLSPIGHAVGLLSSADFTAFEGRRDAVRAGVAAAERVRTRDGEGVPASVAELLRHPELGYSDVAHALPLPPGIGERVAIEVKLAGYVRRQEAAVARQARDEDTTIPESLDIGAVRALSREARDQLHRYRPRSLGAAARVPGLTPADVAVLSVAVHRHTRERAAANAPA